jgi:hypothetical protein
VRRRIITTAVTAAATTGLLTALLAAAPPASADPATVASFPGPASATRYRGPAFDTCTAPSASVMTAWLASPYRAIGVYVGGTNRSCAQPNLTPQWVTAVTGQGWRLLPIYLGLQAPCSDRVAAKKIIPSRAADQGVAAAVDAINSLTALGLRPGSIVYGDIEAYSPAIVPCRDAVLRYVSSFTEELHRHGYLSGIYANLGSGVAHLAASYQSTRYARPDVLWVARWDGTQSLAFAGVPSTSWSVHQRAKQYLGDHDETYGGAKINIDSDWLDAPVGTVARPQVVTLSTQLRTAPSNSATAAGPVAAGTPVQLICQAPGTKVASTTVWDKLSTGAYISDQYLNTPSKTGFSAGLPRCYYPYQVIPVAGTTVRSAVGATAPKKGTLYGGALAWTVCQKAASARTGSTKVWNQLDSGNYVTDFDVATASQTSYTSPIPRC